jgi:hypothetical protein
MMEYWNNKIVGWYASFERDEKIFSEEIEKIEPGLRVYGEKKGEDLIC